MAWNRALVTGASSGIGLSIVRELGRRGVPVVLVARDVERLESLADSHPVEAEVLPADLADADQLATVEARIEEGDIDLVVNNAGFGLNGMFCDHDRDDETNMVLVNVVALHRLSHAAAVTMRSKGRGAILNVASVAAFTSMARSSTYSATKAFVVSFTDALASELKDTGVTATSLCPGLTRTEFHERGDYQADDFPDFAWQSADAVAVAGLDAAESGERRHIPGAVNKVMVGAIKTLPETVVRAVGDRFF